MRRLVLSILVIFIFSFFSVLQLQAMQSNDEREEEQAATITPSEVQPYPEFQRDLDVNNPNAKEQKALQLEVKCPPNLYWNEAKQKCVK
ncbi:MAG: carbohydrate-binding module family 14 protein [Pseudomonadota bacterium]